MADLINPFLMLAGIGMMAVAVIAVLYWRIKSKAPWKWFCFGALVWIAAIAVKLAMDMTISGPMQAGIMELYGIPALIAFASVYVGLRTGFLESGFTYVFARSKAKKNKIGYREAIAFGIGFGAMEAFLLGLNSFLGILVLYLYPGILDSLGVAQKDILLSSLSQSTLIVIPAILERIAAMLIHAFAALLAILAVNSRKAKYLWGSIAYKAVTDGMIPLLVISLGSDLLSSYLIEIPVIILGAIGYLGIRKFRGKFK